MPRRKPSQRKFRSRGRLLRPLRFEPLEDRRLLSITVNTLADENDGINIGGISLRDAISAAAAGDTINFAPALTASGPATILLTHGELAITKSLTINGPGANLLTVDASGNDPTPDQSNGDGSRVMNFSQGTASVSGLKITGGDANTSGGGIRAVVSLSMTNCVVSDNDANGSGGGIYSTTSLTLQNSVVSGNSAIIAFSDDGGGVFIASGTIVGSVISGNHSGHWGGGIKTSNYGTVLISKSTIAGNVALWGAGIYATAQSGSVNILDSTISLNAAQIGAGGASLATVGGTVAVSNTTISGNTAQTEGGGIVASYDGTKHVRLQFCTITNNQALGVAQFGATLGGGGVFARGVQIEGSIIAKNTDTSSTAPDLKSVATGMAATSIAHGLIGNTTGGTFVDNGGNQVGTSGAPVDPLLSGPRPNGGTTYLDGSPQLSHALLPGSPAINAGDPAAVAGTNGVPANDERGAPFARVAGGRIDIGAVESQPNPLPGDFNFNGTVDAADYSVWRDTLGSTTDLRADSSGPTVGTPNGVVDQADYDFWKSHFGSSLTGSAATSVSDTLPKIAPNPESSPVTPVTFRLPPSAVPLTSNPQSENQNPQSTTLAPRSSFLAPDASRDSALLAWLTAQPQSNLPNNRSVKSFSSHSIAAADDHPADSSVDALDFAFDALAVKA